MSELVEVWKPIMGYEGLYEVSNLGNVRSLDRMGKGRGNSMKLHKGKLLNPCYDNNGYLCVVLSKNGKAKKVRLHQLIAQAFIPNPENKPCIDHINTIRDDNRIENLRWCTQKENLNNPISIEKQKEVQGVSVLQIGTDGELIKVWKSIIEAERALCFAHGNICRVCKGIYKTLGGFKWKYYDIETYLIAKMNKTLKESGIVLRNAS